MACSTQAPTEPETGLGPAITDAGVESTQEADEATASAQATPKTSEGTKPQLTRALCELRVRFRLGRGLDCRHRRRKRELVGAWQRDQWPIDQRRDGDEPQR
ncbi:MAG: hypothetical protein B7733_01290 [Myxococcales bacterium FL481]|nr:MAG: hypothetical protein B7733_01290 [Myxococcales bacterium FL481]